MKIFLLGATGPTGKLILSQALDQGYTVSAFVRDPSKLQIKHKNLKIIEGNILDTDSLNLEMKNHETIISAIGASTIRKDPNMTMVKCVENIINSMKKNNIKKLIFMSSLGVADSKTRLNFFAKYIVVPFILKNVYYEKKIQERLIQESNLEWIIVRPARLTDGIKTGKYFTKIDMNNKKLTFKISRADVAEFIIKNINTDLYLKNIVELIY